MDEFFGPLGLDMTVVSPLEHGARMSAQAADANPQRAQGAEAQKGRSQDAAEWRDQGGAYMGIALETTGEFGPNLATLYIKLWRYIKDPHTVNQWTLPDSPVIPLTSPMNDPLWTAPTPVVEGVQRLSTRVRQELHRCRMMRARKLRERAYHQPQQQPPRDAGVGDAEPPPAPSGGGGRSGADAHPPTAQPPPAADEAAAVFAPASGPEEPPAGAAAMVAEDPSGCQAENAPSPTPTTQAGPANQPVGPLELDLDDLDLSGVLEDPLAALGERAAPRS